MTNQNIRLSYLLAFCKNSWFWAGIWVFYYLSFTNYAGIGLIETVMIGTTSFFEVPTGVIADLLGKKRTLLISFLFEAIGGFMMAFAPNFTILAWSVFVMCVGGALYSGTLDALIFDSLKEKNLESKYQKIISNINSVSLFAPAICSIIGGFMYVYSPRLPFLANAVFYS